MVCWAFWLTFCVTSCAVSAAFCKTLPLASPIIWRSASV